MPNILCRFNLNISDNSRDAKTADAADISVLFFSAGANFWAILGHFWVILAILGNFWGILGHLGNFWPFFGAIFFGKICICAI